MTGRIFIIAEAGVNHNGSVALARQLVDAAAQAGANAVKFQTFKAERIVARNTPKAEYQQATTGGSESQMEMLRKLELSHDAHRELMKRCAELGLEFLSTPFDLPSLDFLADDLGLACVKLPSGEITNAPLLHQAARKGLDIILSTGMATLGDVELALGVLANGYLGHQPPSRQAFEAAFAKPEGRAALASKVTLLQCTTEYPAPLDSVNLRAMDTMAQAFGCRVGLSDHTPGIVASVAAAARGASIIEKHFTLDKTLPGPDHQASLTPDELSLLVTSVRQVEAALGDGVKQPAPCELSNRLLVRKSLVASRPIAAGEAMGVENLAVKRPGTGHSPMDWWDVQGRPAVRAYDEDEVIG